MSNNRSLICRAPVIFMKRFQILLYYIEKMAADKADCIVSIENNQIKCVQYSHNYIHKIQLAGKTQQQ